MRTLRMSARAKRDVTLDGSGGWSVRRRLRMSLAPGGSRRQFGDPAVPLTDLSPTVERLWSCRGTWDMLAVRIDTPQPSEGG